MIGERNVTVLRGVAVTPMPAWEKRPKPREADGRVCAEFECGTVLSIYNKGKVCFKHQGDVYKIRRVRRRKSA